MSLSATDIRVRCYISEWVDVGGVRVLLHKLKYEDRADPSVALELSELDKALSSLIGEGKVHEALRSIISVAKLKSHCDLALIDIYGNSIRFSYLISSKRIKCVPLAPIPDVVKSLEVLSRSLDAASVEMDVLQRSILTSSKKLLDPGYYTACLVGEVVNQNTIALGVELLNHGLRTVMAYELKETLIKEENTQVIKAGKKRRKAKRRKRKRS
ncbi:MAG: hypothetical protein QXV72_03665 [Sulfolobales archaeon]